MIKPDEIVESIKQMIGSNSINLSRLYDCFNSIEPPIIVIPLQIPRGQSIIRVRINTTSNCFDDIGELSYPPSDKSKLMRASLPGHPMFYGSIYSKTLNPDGAFPRITTLFETSDKLRDPNFSGHQIVTFSKWRLIDTIRVFALPISNNYREFTYDAINIQNYWNTLFKPNIEIDRGAFSEYMGDLMAEKGSNSIYEVTANFIRYMLDNDEVGYQGIVYPTQQLDGDGFNIALTPSTVDANCQLEHASTCILIKDKKDATLLGIADAMWDTNGHIRWTPKKEVLMPLLKSHPEIVNTLYFVDE